MTPLSLRILIRALLVWLLFMAAESAQGALRQFLVRPEVEFAIRQGSAVIGALIIFGLTWLCFRWMRIRTAAGALAVGVLWVALTLAFEVGLGRAIGLSWSRLLSDYDVTRGGLMPLGLLAMALTPWLVRRLQAPQRGDLNQDGPQAKAGN